MKPITIFYLMLPIALSCNNSSKTFAIKDFNRDLQPYLVKVVSTGVVGYNKAAGYITLHATDKELENLSHAENPVLRSTALRIMLSRPSFNHYNIVMHHLDDTAIVAVDYGEWGIKYFTVSDDMLMNSNWKDTVTKNKVIKEIVLHHNFLAQAYFKSSYLPAEEKYYTSIKKMATYERDEETFTTINYFVIEKALYALARYKKKEDILLIKSILQKNDWQLGEYSFALLEHFPDSSYLSVLEEYFKHHMYHDVCDNWGHSVDKAVNFINSITRYRNERSAKILQAILNRQPFMPCNCDTTTLKWGVAHAINDNMCEAYKGMRTEVNKILEDEKRNTSTFTYTPYIDTTHFPKLAEPIRW